MNDCCDKEELLSVLGEDVKCLSQQPIDNDASQYVLKIPLMIFLFIVVIILIRVENC